MTSDVLLAVIETFAFFAAGGLALRFGYIGRDSIEGWSKFAFNILTPCLTFGAIVGNIRVRDLRELWIMPVAGFSMMLFGALAGWALSPLLRHRTPERLVTFRHICAINNYIFLPLIVVGNIFGAGRHAALLLVMSVGSTIGFWTVGVVTLTGLSRDTLNRAVRQLWSVNVLAVFAALAAVGFGIAIPAPAMKFCNTLGAMAIPLTMILTGAALFRDSAGLFRHKADVCIVALVRLALIPALFIVVLKLLPLPREMYEVCFVVALMPAAVASALVTRLYGGDGEFASQSVVITTVLSLFSMPLLIKLM